MSSSLHFVLDQVTTISKSLIKPDESISFSADPGTHTVPSIPDGNYVHLHVKKGSVNVTVTDKTKTPAQQDIHLKVGHHYKLPDTQGFKVRVAAPSIIVFSPSPPVSPLPGDPNHEEPLNPN